MNSDSQISGQRLHLLEGLRGYLAWWVVVGHCMIEAGFKPEWLPSILKVVVIPGYAVDVFVILSGFVITHLLQLSRPDYRVFILRRFFRLYPLFLVCLAVAVVSFHFNRAIYTDFQKLAPSEAYRPEVWQSHAENLGTHVGVSLSLLHGAIPNQWLPFSYNAFIPPGWSISLEWQFYLLAPLILLGIRQHFAVVCGFAALIVLFRDHYDIGGWGSFLPHHFEFFALGMASHHVFLQLSRREGWLHSTLNITVAMAFLLFLLVEPIRALIVNPYEARISEWLPLCLWLFVLALLVELHGASPTRFALWIGKIFLNRVAQALGKVSYSTYLLHYFGIYLAMTVAVKADLNLDKYRALALLLAIAIPVTLTLSFLAYRFVEVPGISLGRKLADRIGRRQKLAPSDG